jgi:osmotically-inducible protein OsmY
MRVDAPQTSPSPPADVHRVVEEALARHAHLAGRNLRFEVHEDGVVLRGTVRSYYQKQLVQESLKAISSLPRIRNEIEVVSA